MYQFKYVPTKFEDLILEESLQDELSLNMKDLPNMILYGPPGVGKGSYMEVLKNVHPNMEMLKINCSDQTGVDNIRDRVKQFARALSLNGIKIVYLNEADFLSVNAQAMLRDLMETVHDITRFVLCCNYIDNIIPELLSRCDTYYLGNPPLLKVAKRCIDILDAEDVKYSPKTVVEIVKAIWENQPDIRRVLATINRNVVGGKLKNNFKLASTSEVFDSILAAMKQGNPDEVYRLLKSTTINYTRLYDYLKGQLMKDGEVFSDDGAAILHIGEHGHRNVISDIKDLNFITMYVRMLKEGAI